VAFVVSKTVKKLNKISEDEMTLAGRIRIGMAAKGIKTPSELARKLNIKNRQTTTKWLNGEVTSLDPDMLFRLSDLLNLNPRWLLNREGDPAPLREFSPEDRRVLDLYAALPKKIKNVWVKNGDELLEATGETSISQPFKR
jgi:transcriptional regulator with XRE-family HTH domain